MKAPGNIAVNITGCKVPVHDPPVAWRAGTRYGFLAIAYPGIPALAARFYRRSAATYMDPEPVILDVEMMQRAAAARRSFARAFADIERTVNATPEDMAKLRDQVPEKGDDMSLPAGCLSTCDWRGGPIHDSGCPNGQPRARRYP